MNTDMKHISDYDISRTVSATVEKTTRITAPESPEEVRDIQLYVDSDIDFVPGMNIGILVPGPHAFGNDVHLRLYGIADLEQENNEAHITICVKRCSYIDEISGEEYKGVASNYLCDLVPGDTVTLSGPYGSPFRIPEDPATNLVLIAQGTGIAPFRALVRQIYEDHGNWQGRVMLFYGARSGLELLYMNDERNDLANYYDQNTFEAFQAVSPRPHLGDPVALDTALEQQASTVWSLIRDPDTYVFIAGITAMRPALEKAFVSMAGSTMRWERVLAELKAGGRWQELLY